MEKPVLVSKRLNDLFQEIGVKEYGPVWTYNEINCLKKRSAPDGRIEKQKDISKGEVFRAKHIEQIISHYCRHNIERVCVFDFISENEVHEVKCKGFKKLQIPESCIVTDENIWQDACVLVDPDIKLLVLYSSNRSKINEVTNVQDAHKNAGGRGAVYNHELISKILDELISAKYKNRSPNEIKHTEIYNDVKELYSKRIIEIDPCAKQVSPSDGVISRPLFKKWPEISRKSRNSKNS